MMGTFRTSPESEGDDLWVRQPAIGSLSVVVVARGHEDALLRLLQARVPRWRAARAEMLVVHAATTSYGEMLRAAFPDVRFLTAPADATLTALLDTGMRNATGGVITFVDDAWWDD